MKELHDQKNFLELDTSQLDIQKQQFDAMAENFRLELERAHHSQQQHESNTVIKNNQLHDLNAEKAQLESIVVELRSDRRLSEERVAKLQDEKKYFESKTLQLESEKYNLNEIVRRLNQELEQACSTQTYQKSAVDGKNEEIKSLRAGKLQLEGAISELLDNQSKWEAYVIELQDQINLLTSTASSMGTEKDQYDIIGAELQQQLKQAHSVQQQQELDLQGKSKQLISLDSDKVQLEQMVNELQATQREQEKIITELQNKKGSTESMTSQLETETQNLLMKNNEVQEQLEQAYLLQNQQNLDLKVKDEQLAALNAEKTNLESTVAQLRATQCQWEETVAELQGQKKYLESAILQLQTEKHQLDVIVEDFQQQLQRAYSAQQQQKLDTEVKDEKLYHLNAEKIKLENVIVELRATQSKWEATVAELENQKSWYESTIAQLETEKQQLGDNVKDLQQQLERAYMQQQQQQLDSKLKNEQLSVISVEKENLEGKITELQAMKSQMEATAAELHSQKSCLASTNLQLETEKQQLDNIADDLRTQLSLWQTEAKSEEEKRKLLTHEKVQLLEVMDELKSQNTNSSRVFNENNNLKSSISTLKQEKGLLEVNTLRMQESERVLAEEVKSLRKQLKLKEQDRPVESKNLGSSFLAKAPEIIVQGDSLKTWSFTSAAVERVQVLLKTEGRPLDADVELWAGPDNIPNRIRFYSENGSTRPFNAIIETPTGPNTVAVRNIGQMEFPVTAQIDAVNSSEPSDIITSTNPTAQSTVVQGGALRTYPFEPNIESIQILLKTDGRPLNARIELLQGPNNIKQVIEVYTEDGLKRPLYTILETPGSGNIVWIRNTASVEFPMTALVTPHKITDENTFQDMKPVIGGLP